ncbi:MAG: metallopeptidase TldD-related protein [Acidimicrobiales bacterium]
MSGSGLAAPHDVIERGLSAAGGDPCIVVVEESSEVEIRFANGSPTTNGTRRDRQVTVVRIAPGASRPGRDGRGDRGDRYDRDDAVAAGVVGAGGDVDVVALVAAAGRDARHSAPAPDARPLVEGGADGAFTLPPPATGVGALDPVIDGLFGVLARSRAGTRPAVLAGYAEHRVVTTYLGTTTGLRRRHVQPTGALHLAGRSDDGRRSSWAGAATSDFDDVSVEELEEKVHLGLERAKRRIALDAGRYEVILPPEAVADLMVALIDAAGGPDAEEGRTVFSVRGPGSGPSALPGRRGTRVGEMLSSLPFDLWSDPDAAGLECTPFLVTPTSSSDVSVFDNGLPLRRTTWMAGGSLERLRYHRAGARRSGAPVAPPVDNLVLELQGARGSVSDLVARTERGLLLTCLWYIREVDPTTLLLTGLTRDGVYVVEDGRVVGATNNFRFNESPVDLLARATEAGASQRALGREFGEWMSRTRMPAIRVPDFNMSSVSPAS